jgi:hypothetical protein
MNLSNLIATSEPVIRRLWLDTLHVLGVMGILLIAVLIAMNVRARASRSFEKERPFYRGRGPGEW